VDGQRRITAWRVFAAPAAACRNGAIGWCRGFQLFADQSRQLDVKPAGLPSGRIIERRIVEFGRKRIWVMREVSGRSGRGAGPQNPGLERRLNRACGAPGAGVAGCAEAAQRRTKPLNATATDDDALGPYQNTAFPLSL